MFRNMRLIILFDMFLNPSFKMMTSFANIARTRNVVIFFFQTILSFVLSRKIINIYNNIAPKYENVTLEDFRKYEKKRIN